MNEDLAEFINPNSCTDAINEPARCGEGVAVLAVPVDCEPPNPKGGSPRCSDWRRVSPNS
ncbi:hypothetical protein [Nostoc sp.]|uniref:hypothetical protein n=1 Tax=Nostoc sp. TaxID=1180 RepID=UPI002FFA308B